MTDRAKVPGWHWPAIKAHNRRPPKPKRGPCRVCGSKLSGKRTAYCSNECYQKALETYVLPERK